MKRKGLGFGRGRGYKNLLPNDRLVHQLSAKGINSTTSKKTYSISVNTKKCSKCKINTAKYGTLCGDCFIARGSRRERSRKMIKRNLDAKATILSSKNFDNKFSKDYAVNEIGYATTRFDSNGTPNIFIRDSGNDKRNQDLKRHEEEEIKLYEELTDAGLNPNIADELAHNLNPVKLKNVSLKYPLDPTN